MRKIEFKTTLYARVGEGNEEWLVEQCLLRGEKHQDFSFGVVEILSAENYEDEDE